MGSSVMMEEEYYGELACGVERVTEPTTKQLKAFIKSISFYRDRRDNAPMVPLYDEQIFPILPLSDGIYTLKVNDDYTFLWEKTK